MRLRRRKDLKRLSELLVDLGARSQSTRDPVREATSNLAQLFHNELDDYWTHSESGRAFPFDVIDFFSGCGGMSAGFRASNAVVPAYRVTAAIDIDPVANSTYESNFGIRPIETDIGLLAQQPAKMEKLLAGSGRRKRNPLVLIGCAPCQGFSSQRNEAGEADPRNSLFVNFAKIAAQVKPAAVVVENVPELLSDRYWPIVSEARRILENAGYYVHLTVHNMAEFGLPQERFRALMLAMPHPFKPPLGFLARGRFQTVRQAIGELPFVLAGEKHADDPMHYSTGHKKSTLDTIRAVPMNGGNRPEDVGPACLRRAAKKHGRAAWEDVYGRLFWDKPAITITAYARNPASGRFIHPEQDRGLTVREAALLQGFPRTFHFSGTLDERFRQIGNAVPPIFAGYLATYLLGEFLGKPVPSKIFHPGITAPVGRSFSRLIPALKAGYRNVVDDFHSQPPLGCRPTQLQERP